MPSPPRTHALVTSPWILEQIVENSPFGMMLVDVRPDDWPTIYVNPAFETLTGYRADEIIGRNPRFLRGSDHDQEGRRIIREAVQKGQDCTAVLRNYRKDGSMFWNELHLAPIRDPQGQVTHYVGKLLDITARKEAELRYRSLFDQSNDAVYIFDLQGRYLEVNRRAAELLGYTVEELTRLSIYDVVEPEVRQSADAVLRRLLAGEHVPPYERVFRSRDGRSVYGEVNIQLVCDAAGSPLHFQSIVRDITARKQMEDALRESEANYRLIAENSSDGIIVWDALQARIIFASPGYDRMMGRPVGTSQGLALQDIVMDFHPDDRRDTLQRLAQAMQRREETFTYTYRTRHADGSYRWHESHANFKYAQDGSSILAYAVIRDITERQQAQEREFALALEKERTLLLTRFIQHAAHEFRTPLAIIASSAYLLSKLDDAERRQSKIDQIEAQVGRIGGLIDKLLMMIKLETGEVIEQTRIVTGTLLEMQCAHSVTIRSGRPQLRCEVLTGLPAILGDAGYLSYALGQLLDNAYRFSPPDGLITLAAGAADGRVWIEIRDSGPGIAPEDLPHVVETFWRHDEAHTTAGFGLGLSIVRRVVELHGGVLHIDSTPGQGTCARVTLPAAPPLS